MLGAKHFALFSIPAVLALLAAGGYVILRAAAGIPGFYAWKVFSGKANGGHYIDTSKVRIYFETFGSGQPVLVLHGGLGCLEAMQRQIRVLAQGRLVIAMDSRGHGRSTNLEDPLSYVQMADDAVALLDRLAINRADVVGWSDGGIIGLDLAMRYPGRIGKLVAIGSNFDVAGLAEKPAPAAETPPGGSCQRHSPNPAHWPALYRKVISMWQTQPHYTLEDLGKIEAPALIMAGEFDMIRRSHTDQLARAIPRAQERIIKGGTHSIVREKSKAVNALILKFLDKTSASY